MKALGKNTLRHRAEQEVKKVYDELYYEAFRESAPETMRQTLAVVLYALSLHGYGEKRLKQVLDWTQAVLRLPGCLGKSWSCTDCADTLKKRYDIDLSGITPNIETWEEYKKK